MANKGALAVLTVVAAVGTVGAYFALKDKLGPGPGPGPEPDKLQASISANPKTGEAPLTVNFILSIQGGIGPFNVVWAFGDGKVGSGLAPQHTYTIPGSYQVSTTITDSQGKQLTVFEGIGVDKEPPPPPPPTEDVIKSFSFFPDGGDQPLAVTFNIAISDSRALVEWDFGDGATAINQGGKSFIQNHQYNSSGFFTGQVKVTNEDGKQDTKTFSVTVIHGDPPTTNFIKNFTQSKNSGQVPLDVSFSFSSSEIIESGLWDFGDGTTLPLGNNLAASHIYQKPGTFFGRVTAKSVDGIQDTKTFTVIVTDSVFDPMGEIIITGKSGNKFTFLANFNGKAPLTYKWDFGDGPIGFGQPTSGKTVEHTYNQAGTFVVRVIVTDPDGRQGIDTVTITATVQTWKLGDVVIRSIVVSQLNSITARIAVSIRNDNFFVRGAVTAFLEIRELPSKNLVTLKAQDTFLTEGDIDTMFFDCGLFPGSYEAKIFVWEKGTAVPLSFPKTKTFNMV